MSDKTIYKLKRHIDKHEKELAIQDTQVITYRTTNRHKIREADQLTKGLIDRLEETIRIQRFIIEDQRLLIVFLEDEIQPFTSKISKVNTSQKIAYFFSFLLIFIGIVLYGKISGEPPIAIISLIISTLALIISFNTLKNLVKNW